MENFYFLYTSAGLKNEQELAELFEVNLKTVKKWRSTRKPPRAVFLYLKLLAGELSGVHKNWHGFRLSKDAIESPTGDFIYYHEIKAIKYVYQAAGIERHRICNLMKNQPPTIKPHKRMKTPARDSVKQSSVVLLQSKSG